MLAFSISDALSFETVQNLAHRTKQIRGVNPCAFSLVGTKADQEYDREVSDKEALALAKRLQCSYIEVPSPP